MMNKILVIDVFKIPLDQLMVMALDSLFSGIL